MLDVIQRAINDWWRELIFLTFLNVVWLLLVLPIVTIAPATAAYYVVAQHVSKGHEASWQDFWQGFKQYFWKALRWGLLSTLVYFIAIYNFAFYASAGGIGWGLIKITWGLGLILWTIIQLLYWPLMLEAENQSIANTLRNALVMLWLNPLFIILFAVISCLIVAFSLVTAISIGIIMMPMLTLIGTIAVQDRLQTSSP